jgi:ABC-type Fe3+-hydroxamate transport system substrate-binding protein
VLYRSLQLAMPERLRQWIAGKQAAIGYNWLAITPDELGGFEADYLFFVVDSDHDRRLVLNWQRTNAAWMRHPAIRSRNVYFLDWSKWIVYAPIGLQRQLEEAEYIWSRSSALLDYV